MSLFSKFFNKSDSKVIKQASFEEDNLLPLDGVVFHEDDRQQVELLPYHSIPGIQKEMQEIDNFSAEHFNGLGFTDMYVRDNDAELENLRISPAELEELLSESGYPRYDHFLNSYGDPYDIEIWVRNTIAFGSQYKAVFYSFMDDVVTSIWLTHTWEFDDQLVSCVEKISQKWNLILADWNSLEIVDSTSKEKLNDYFSSWL